MRPLYNVLLLLLTPFIVISQGLVINDHNYASVTLLENSEGSKSLNKELENTYDFTLRNYCPTPRDQGDHANCVGWSIGYAAQTIREAFKLKLTSQEKVDSIALSPYFIYNNVKIKDCKLGAEIPEALQFLVRTGNVPHSLFEQGKFDCFLEPENNLYKKAQNYRIKDFVKLFNPDDNKLTKVNAVKEAIFNGFPVIIAMNITESFYKIEKGQKLWHPELGSQVPLGGHALVAIGFDELKNAFEVMNSWGTNWADNGFGWIKYDDFSKFVKYGFIFDESETELFSIQFNFKRKNLITLDKKVYFESELFRWDGRSFINASRAYQPNTTYVIDIFHSDPDYYIYCFNAGSDKNFVELFRIDDSSDQTRVNLKDYVKDHGLSIPPLLLEDPEAERFVFLISKKKINEEIIINLSEASTFDDFYSILSSKNVLITRPKYAFNRAGYTGIPREGSVLVLPVELNNY